MKYKYIAWDFNGTLIDDVGAALSSVNDILARRGRPPITLDDYYSYLDTPIRRFYEHLFDLNEISFEVLADEFQNGYARHYDECALMSGADALLHRLRQNVASQFIISSSKQSQIERQLSDLGIREYFDAVLGSSDIYATGKVGYALKFFAERNIPLSDSVMIGDCLHDREVAQSIGIDCILLSRGHQSREDLLSAGVPVAESMNEIAVFLGL